MHTLSIKIPEQLNRQLASEVARRRVKKSTLVREALEKHLASNGGARKSSKFSMQAGDLIGIFSGPGDVSTNPKYMKDFGK
jgi:Arc/MetJ-type ribon-helix-helix transcriptional regulator